MLPPLPHGFGCWKAGCWPLMRTMANIVSSRAHEAQALVDTRSSTRIQTTTDLSIAAMTYTTFQGAFKQLRKGPHADACAGFTSDGPEGRSHARQGVVQQGCWVARHPIVAVPDLTLSTAGESLCLGLTHGMLRRCPKPMQPRKHTSDLHQHRRH